ncbi:MAG: HD domain-containing protein [Kiritimatiellae bacterium]|nr:HD domain-containing protein [Kiritimatiellia bacterium]
MDDEPMIGKLLSRILQNHDCEVRFETTVADAISAITEQPNYFDIILTDLNLPGKSGLDLLDELRSIDEGLIKIIITGHATLDNAITCLRRGAYDFIEKPVVPESLVAIIDRALEFRRLKRENARYQAHLEDMVHEKSAALLDALDHIKTSYDFTLEAMASLLDERDSGTADHSLRIRALAGIIAREMGLSSSEIEEIERAALLHDIGKIAVPDRILLKPGQLTPEERLEMERHPEVAFKMLNASPHLETVAAIVRAHHEWFDGTGYPRRLKGADIPLGARIISLIDAYDAMRSNRVHRQGVSSEAALKEIETNAGAQFDPQLVELFKRCQIAIELAANWDQVNAKSDAKHRNNGALQAESG